MASPTAEQKPSIDIVYAAICELTAEGIPASRKSIQVESGIPQHIVDDAIIRLKDIGKVITPSRGYYLAKDRFSKTRPVSSTILSSGEVKLEVGDEVLTLTPREAKNVSVLMFGNIVKLIQEN